MNGYIAFFGDRQVEVHAETLYAAKQQALEVFRPAKSKRHLVSVQLVEKAGEQVIHAPDM